MLFKAIDSLLLSGSAASPWERVGWCVGDESMGIRTLKIGSAANPASLHFISDSERIGRSGAGFRQVVATGQGLFAIGLRVANWDATLTRLEARGIHAVPLEEMRPRCVWLALLQQSGANLMLADGNETDKPARNNQDGRSDSRRRKLPVKRLDHLAIVAHDLDEKTRFWSDILDVPVTGEVATPTMVIRQLKIGDAVLELLGPATSESPLWKRTPGLVSMISWEVSDMGEAVEVAREAGFSVPDPAAGPLPGTRITTIPGTEFGGVNLQLLEFV